MVNSSYLKMRKALTRDVQGLFVCQLIDIHK